MVNDAVILNVDNLRQRLKGDLTCLFHPPKRGVHMMPCPLNCGSWWCPNSKVILSLIDHPSRAQGHVCRKQKKSYKERFSSGVYAIYSQAHIPSPNFSSEHHTSHPNYLLGFSMLPKRHLKFNVQNWMLGFSALYPLSNLLFPLSFLSLKIAPPSTQLPGPKRIFTVSTSPSHNPPLTISMASISWATIYSGLGHYKNLFTGFLASTLDPLPLLLAVRMTTLQSKSHHVPLLHSASDAS